MLTGGILVVQIDCTLRWDGVHCRGQVGGAEREREGENVYKVYPRREILQSHQLIMLVTRDGRPSLSIQHTQVEDAKYTWSGTLSRRQLLNSDSSMRCIGQNKLNIFGLMYVFRGDVIITNDPVTANDFMANQRPGQLC